MVQNLKAFEISINIAPLIPPLYKHFRQFSVITRRQCCMLKSLRNPHCHSKSISLNEIFIHLIVVTPLTYLLHIRQDAYWTIVSNVIPVSLFKNWNYICIFQFWGESRIKYRIIEVIKNKFRKISILSLIIFTGLSLSWQAFLLSWLWISAKLLFFVSKLNEKERKKEKQTKIISFLTLHNHFLLFCNFNILYSGHRESLFPWNL